MATKSPWSVKGVSQEDRDQAKSAARRAGVPVGVWLSRQIRAAESRNHTNEGDDEKPDQEEVALPSASRGQSFRGGHGGRFRFGPGQWSSATEAVEAGQFSQPAPHPEPPRLQPGVSGSNHAVNHGGHHAPSMATHWGMPPLAHPMYLPQRPQAPTEPNTPVFDPEALKELEKRLTSAETKFSRDLDDVCSRLEKVDGLEKRIHSVQVTLDSKTETVHSVAPVERAVIRLSERLQRVEDLVLPVEPKGGFLSRLFRRR